MTLLSWSFVSTLTCFQRKKIIIVITAKVKEIVKHPVKLYRLKYLLLLPYRDTELAQTSAVDTMISRQQFRAV